MGRTAAANAVMTEIAGPSVGEAGYGGKVVHLHYPGNIESAALLLHTDLTFLGRKAASILDSCLSN